MNERIKELARQATKEVWGNNPHNGAPEFEGYELDQEKFAELIVRECLSMMENCDGDLDFAIWNTKKHFGVEE